MDTVNKFLEFILENDCYLSASGFIAYIIALILIFVFHYQVYKMEDVSKSLVTLFFLALVASMVFCHLFWEVNNCAYSLGRRVNPIMMLMLPATLWILFLKILKLFRN